MNLPKQPSNCRCSRFSKPVSPLCSSSGFEVVFHQCAQKSNDTSCYLTLDDFFCLHTFILFCADTFITTHKIQHKQQTHKRSLFKDFVLRSATLNRVLTCLIINSPHETFCCNHSNRPRICRRCPLPSFTANIFTALLSVCKHNVSTLPLVRKLKLWCRYMASQKPEDAAYHPASVLLNEMHFCVLEILCITTPLKTWTADDVGFISPEPLQSESVKTSSKFFCFCSHSEPINDCMNEVPRFLQSILNANWSLCLRYPTNLPNEDHDCWVGFFRSQANVLTAYWMSNLSWLKYMAIPTIDTLTPLTLTTVRKDVRMLE